MPRVGVPEGQAMPAPPASSYWGQRPLEGAGQHGRREGSRLNWQKPLGKVQQKSPAELSPSAQRRGDGGSASLSLISRQG